MSPQQLQIRLLGPLEVVAGGRALDLPPSRKARALLAYLAATGRSHSRSALCDLFWQEVNDPRAGLRWALSKLREVVDDDACRRVVTSRNRVGFEETGADVDLHRVRAAVSTTHGDAPTDALEEATRAFRGEFLEGLDLPRCHQYQAWCLGERERLRNAHVSIHATLTARLRDRPEQALHHALSRLTLDPFSEGAYTSAIEVLGDLGHVERGLELYDRCRRMLADHLGAPPSEELEAARRRLKDRRRPASPTADETAGQGTAERDRAAAALGEAPATAGLSTPAPNETPLVGREAELRDLARLLGEAASGHGARMALVTGEPGIGKTRLLRELVANARSLGGWAISAQAFETEEVRPYGPWIDMLRQVPPALLDRSRAGGLSGLLGGRTSERRQGAPTERAELFDAVGALLRTMADARAPGLVALDDVQWLDASSAALLHYVIRTLDASPLVFVLAAREEEIGSGSPTARAVRSVGDPGPLHRVRLGRLDAPATGALVRAFDAAVDPGPVFATSEGNPLFALAVAASLRDGTRRVPSSIEDEVRARLERLDPVSASVLPWAAALGRAFEVPTLIRVVDRPSHEIVEAVDRLERRGILRPAGADTYDFSHSLLRQAAYERLSEPTRRAIHRTVARALDAVDPGQGRLPGAIAHHAELGGLPALAAGASIEAAQVSLWAFAYDEAGELVERGLRQVEAVSGESRLPLEMGLLRIYTFRVMQGRRPADVEARVRRVTEAARGSGAPEVVATGHALLMELQYQRGAFREAGRSSVRSAEAGREAGADTAIRTLAETGACLLLLDQAPEDARRLASEAFALAESHGVSMDAVELARALLHHHDGELAAAFRAFGEVVRLGRLAKDRWWECPAMTRRVMVDLDRGDPEAARACAREAEETAERACDEEEAAFARGLGAVAAETTGEPAGMAAVDASLDELRELDSLLKIGQLQAYAAEVELARGRPVSARRRSAEALDAGRTLERPSLRALAHAQMALAAAVEGEHDEAVRHLEAAEGDRSDRSDRPASGLSHRARAALRRAHEGV